MEGNEYVLVHAGVKGMKWGVRRAQKQANKTYRKIGQATTDAQRNKLRKQAKAQDEYTARLDAQYKQARRAKNGKRIATLAVAALGALTIKAIVSNRKKKAGEGIVGSIIG